MTAEQASKAWGRKVVEADSGNLRLSEDVIRDAAESNRAGDSDYLLIYCLGLSLREQRESLGSDRERQPCFFDQGDWWMDPEDDEWATIKPQPGYRLLDYKLKYLNLSWQAQENEIARLGQGFSRAHETDVAGGCLSYYKVMSENVLERRHQDSDSFQLEHCLNIASELREDWYVPRLLEEGLHWGCSQSSSQDLIVRVGVGQFREPGLVVGGAHENTSGPYCGVVIERT
ncbi:MAG: hypothetical protein M9921_10130 [Fimbriimonadaceae bacterium]|nr:hypothetical protein [Fimbriimonadaceae bacterium]